MLKRRTYVTKQYELRNLERARGKKFDCDLVPADTARNMVLEARDRGLTYPEISRLTGVEKNTLGRLIWQNRKLVTRRIERQIMRGLQDPDARSIAPNSLVPITVERQMVRSLMAQGWTCMHLYGIIQQNGRGSGSIVKQLLDKPNYKYARAEKLANVYWLVEVIGDKLGPSLQNRAKLPKKGVFPLKHYDSEGKLDVRTLSDEQRQWVQ